MIDPYFDTQFCVDRLYNEYKKYGKLIVALDYDDTIYDFHGKGYIYDKVLNLIRECQKLGFYIVIFTGCPKEKYDSIRANCVSLGINITKINENAFPMPIGNDGKIYFNILLDDRSGLFQAYTTLKQTVDKINDEKRT